MAKRRISEASTFIVKVPNSSTAQHGGWRDAHICFGGILATAAKSILLVTPYFVRDRGLRKQLILAARRGVDVCVLTTEKTDSAPAQWAARAFYGELIENAEPALPLGFGRTGNVKGLVSRPTNQGKSTKDHWQS